MEMRIASDSVRRTRESLAKLKKKVSGQSGYEIVHCRYTDALPVVRSLSWKSKSRRRSEVFWSTPKGRKWVHD